MKLLDKAILTTGKSKEEILKRYCVSDFGIKQTSNRKCRQSECESCWNKYEVGVG